MEDLFEDTESEPYRFIVLDSQDTENIPPLWNDASILKSLPALQIPETQVGKAEMFFFYFKILLVIITWLHFMFYGLQRK